LRSGERKTAPPGGVSHSAFEIVSTDLLRTLFPMEKAVRLLGVSISGFVDQENLSVSQISLL
jgi:hypothetical protein